MQPVKMCIPGKYWDSFIYKGRIYLFGINGDIRSLDWDRLIFSWRIPEKIKIAFECAFQRSDYLYSGEVQNLLNDQEIKLIVEKKWDGPVLGLSAAYGALAMAAGSEGLYEFDLNLRFGAIDHLFCAIDFDKKNPHQLSSTVCRDCGWAYWSVFASSDTSGYLAEFSKHNDNNTYDREAERHFERVENAPRIFGSDGFCWGVQDKLCQAVPNAIKVVKYSPWEEDPKSRIHHVGMVNFASWQGSVISASTASFGMVVELENAIVVFPSHGQEITLPGEPINWRIFPRSKHYENQLHIIYDDHLEILSFNQDYLVNQEDNISGISIFSQQKRNKNLMFRKENNELSMSFSI
ncbi:MAG: hypothetical protein H7833_09710 [Magnetococcus sp. DMHC-1]|nr:hypothetical protein [Magnetococcales bacterium]